MTICQHGTKSFYVPIDPQAQYIQIESTIFLYMSPKPPPQFPRPLNDIAFYPTAQAKSLRN